MDAPTSIDPVYPVPYLSFILLVFLGIALYFLLEHTINLSNVQANWAEYRCQPHIMPFASLFGHDVNENFQFCIQQIIQDKTTGIAAPFAQGMGGFTSVLMNLINSANSFRVMLATLVGGVVKIISEFKARMTALMGRVKTTASRMKAMMYRIYGTMFAVMYMGMSTMTGILNFGDSFIFGFIDTFCFPPEQHVIREDMTVVAIRDIVVGDVLQGGHRVETIYRFAADGQPMVTLGNVTVSSNHFVRYKENWIMAKDHPDAILFGMWSGGLERPLICLTTHDHKIPIEDYIFADYDETDQGNHVTQEWVGRALNGVKSYTIDTCISYEVGSPSTTFVKTYDGYKTLSSCKLGDRLESSKIIGIQISNTDEVCHLPDGQSVCSGSLLWSPLKGEWIRAYTMYPIDKLPAPVETIALFVSPGAQYELEGGHRVRDAMEVYSPETKQAYADILLKKN